MPDSQRMGRLGRIGRWLVLGCGGALLLATGAETVALPATHWRLERDLVAAIGLLFIAASLALRWARPQLAVAMAVGSLLICGLLAIASHSPKGGESSWSLLGPGRVWNTPRNWVEIVIDQHDRRFGHAARAGATQRQKHETDYDVTYHFDQDGWRVMPASNAPAAQRPMLFVGCSFTFGMGVSDDQPFPALLARQAWPGQRVWNHAIAGWGSGHALLAIDEALQSDSPPRVVFYGYLSRHIGRNYLSRGWHPMQRADFPYFELDEQGQLEFRGIVPPGTATWEESPRLAKREQDVTLQLIEQMDHRCRAADATFVLLFLESRAGGDPVIQALQERGRIHLLDLSTQSDDIYPTDWHPTARWHQTIAAAIAGAPQIAEWTGISELHQPGAILPAEPRWRLAICQCGAKATLHWRRDDEPILRVENIELSAEPKSWDIELHRGVFALEPRQTCHWRMKVRADRPREATVAVGNKEHSPWPARQLNLGADWRSFEEQFTAQSHERGLFLSISLGHSDVPLEVTSMQVLVDGKPVVEPAADEE